MLKVSIIMPVYNTEKYLIRAISSIVGQTYKDWEFILVDDGSTDRSGDICRKQAAQDARIRYLKKPNGGVSSARNYGLELANGDAVIFVDGDDWLAENALERLITGLTENEADICFCGMTDYTEGRESYRIPDKEKQFSIQQFWEEEFTLLLESSLIQGIGAKIYRKNILENIRFHTEFFLHEDGIFTVEALQNCNNVSCLKIPLYYYYHHSDSLSNAFRKNDFDAALYFYRLIEKESERFKAFSKCEVFIKSFLLYSFLGAIKNLYSKSDMDSIENKSFISKTLEIEEVKKALMLKTNMGFKNRLMLWLLKKGYINMADRICSLAYSRN